MGPRSSPDRACEAELAEAIEAELDAGRLVPLHLYDELGTVRVGDAA